MICVIPARGGSRRIPMKNIRPFNGRPIITYALETALSCGLFRAVVVSTDDARIARVVRDHCPAVMIHKRKSEHARDEVGTQAVMRTVLRDLEASYHYPFACCLYATTPLLTPGRLREGYRILQYPGTEYVVSVGGDPLRDAGGFYFGKTDAFLSGTPLWGPMTRMLRLPDNEVCDINTEKDWQQALELFNRGVRKHG